jgi:hypothetical protein
VDALVNGGPKPTLAAFCRYVEGSVGAAASEHLVWWLQHVFDAEAQTHRALDRWSRVLRHCQREGDGGWRQLAFPEPLSNEASSRFATCSASRCLSRARPSPPTWSASVSGQERGLDRR